MSSKDDSDDEFRAALAGVTISETELGDDDWVASPAAPPAKSAGVRGPAVPPDKALAGAATSSPAKPAAAAPQAAPSQTQRPPKPTSASEISPADPPADASKEEEEEEEEEAPGAGGGGWGGWGALGRLGAAVQSAAAIAAKDVSGLAESFQQVLVEVAAASDDEDQPGGGGAAVVGAKPAGEEAFPDPAADPSLSPEEAARRRRVLERLQGDDAGGGGGAGALGALWTWGGTLAAKVEQAATTAARELSQTAHDAKPALAGMSSNLAVAGTRAEFRLGQTLGAFSRTAQSVLGSGMELVHGEAGGGEQGGRRPGAGGGAGGEALTFEECAAVYGAPQSEEELLRLSSDCSRACNRARAGLPPSDQAAMDAVLEQLAPAFNLGAPHPADGEGAPGDDAAGAALGRGHQILADLAGAAVDRAGALAAGAAQKSSQLLAGAPPAAAAAAAPAPAAARALRGLKDEGTQRLAEVGAVCMELLLNLGRSLSAHARFQRVSSDGVAWPEHPAEAAALLRGQARRMLEEVAGVLEAFVAALSSTGALLDAEAASGEHGALAAALAAGLRADGELARGAVQQAFKALMYVAWEQTLGGGGDA